MIERVFGVDFTSAPRRDKPIVIAECVRQTDHLLLERFREFRDWPAYEYWLAQDGPWIAGFDFPFGLPSAFVHWQRWPGKWDDLIRHCVSLGKDTFANLAMKEFQTPGGNKSRRTDHSAKSNSPLKTKANPPVGLMFYEGTWRLLVHEIHIPGLRDTGSSRVAIEAFPRLLVQRLGESGNAYKNDREHSTDANLAARKRLVDRLIAGESEWIPRPVRLAEPGVLDRMLHSDGDWLDAVLCAVQADWALDRRAQNYGLPEVIDPVEGWIISADHP